MTSFILNGRREEVDLPASTTLLRYLRDVRGLTGSKDGCSQNHCGACTVIVDGNARRACTIRLSRLEGTTVETIEGLARPGVLHPIQAAFLAAGAVQCGFCTPGMVMATRALLLRDPDPDDDAIRHALKGNICRCTGYVKIIAAVRLAAGWIRDPGEIPARWATPAAPAAGGAASEVAGLGACATDVDGPAKAQGSLTFADDLSVEGMLYAAVVWSPHAHAELVSVDTGKAAAAPGVVAVLTGADVPGRNGMGSLVADQPVLCVDRVRYVGDAVAVVLADSLSAARAARELIAVEYRELPGAFSPDEGLAVDAPLLHQRGNVSKHLKHEVGDVQAAFAEAAMVVEGRFVTPFVEHAYLEPECALAQPDGRGGVVLRAPTQFPFELRRQLAAMLDLEEAAVRVVVTPLGGAFGSKLDNTTEALACLGAHRTGRPVKLTFTREESLRVSTKRHAYSLDYRVALDPDGRLLGVDARLLSDAGPYTALSPRVIDQACLFSCGPYRVPHVRVEGWAVHTNNANGSAFRGFGINQAAVAIESLLDEAAHRLGIDPFEIRLRNALAAGDRTVSGEILRTSVTTGETIEAARNAFRRVQPELEGLRRPGWSLGVGVASGFKNVGAGKGKVDDAGAIFTLLEDGSVELRASAVDMGQGIRTALVQIATQVLGVGSDRLRIVTGDTGRTMRHGGAVGERQTLIAGKAVELAALEFAGRLIDTAAAVTSRAPGDLVVEAGELRARSGETVLTLEELAGELRGSGETVEAEYYHVAPATYALADEEARRTVPAEDYRNYPAYAYATQAVVVEVEESTGRVRVLRVIAAHDCGRAINPLVIEGQIEGSCAQGMGYALSESYPLVRGIPQARSFKQLGVPTILDAPEVEVILVEEPEPFGPFGAKGISEVATVPVTPAILNAIYDATGARIYEIPATPDKVRTAWEEIRAVRARAAEAADNDDA